MHRKIIPSYLYDKDYYESEYCEGYFEYRKRKLSEIKKEEIRLLELKRSDKVLDVGCGRGDIVYYLSLKNYDFIGIDYAIEAIRLTRKRIPPQDRKRIIHCNAVSMPFASEYFDKIVIGDVIEHMGYDQALDLINESYRVLKKRGMVVIHTSPNLVFKTYSYPILKVILKILGQKKLINNLSNNITATYKYHIDEYSLSRLKSLLIKSRFKKNTHIWLHPDVLRYHTRNYLDPIKNNLFVRIATGLINNTFLINFFGNDLFAIARK